MITDTERAAAEFAALDAMIREMHPRPGDTRTCPDCGRPQHYTGIEAGWSHDAGWAHVDLTDTWHCNDPRKAGA